MWQDAGVEMQLVARVDDIKLSRLMTPNGVTQQNILFVEQIKLILKSFKPYVSKI
jgi:hypothetical protein